MCNKQYTQIGKCEVLWGLISKAVFRYQVVGGMFSLILGILWTWEDLPKNCFWAAVWVGICENSLGFCMYACVYVCELFIREVEMDASFLFSVIKSLILIYNQTYGLGVDSSDSQPQPEDIVSFFPPFFSLVA